jgi:hypothetical protein
MRRILEQERSLEQINCRRITETGDSTAETLPVAVDKWAISEFHDYVIPVWIEKRST